MTFGSPRVNPVCLREEWGMPGPVPGGQVWILGSELEATVEDKVHLSPL